MKRKTPRTYIGLDGVRRKHRSGAYYNHVCVSCRKTYKTSLCKCPECKSDVINMGARRKIPVRTDDKGWKKLKEVKERHDQKELKIETDSILRVFKEVPTKDFIVNETIVREVKDHRPIGFYLVVAKTKNAITLRQLETTSTGELKPLTGVFVKPRNQFKKVVDELFQYQKDPYWSIYNPRAKYSYDWR